MPTIMVELFLTTSVSLTVTESTLFKLNCKV